MIISHSRRHTYTVRAITAVLAVMCVLLLVYAKPALRSASEALTLFFSRVLPALFPFYVLTSMLFTLGAFDALTQWRQGALLPCLLMGGIAGNPTGARVSVLLCREEYAAACNLCSPMFLLSVVAIGFCNHAALFWPLAIAHYGSALLLIPLCRAFPHESAEPTPPAKREPASLTDLFSDIGGGVLAMLNIGGCIVFFYVLANTLLSALVPDRFPLLAGCVMGIVEMTAGSARIASLPLPVPVQAGMLAFTVTFGGLCVFAQSMITAKLRHPGAYLMQKLMQGCIAGILCYLLTPLFIRPAAPAWSSSADEYIGNALIGLTFLLSAGVGLVATYLFALLTKRARANRPGSRVAINICRPRRHPRRHPR